MQSDFDRICGVLGLQPTVLEHINTSVHADYRSYYTPGLKDKVTSLYADDLALFKYSF